MTSFAFLGFGSRQKAPDGYAVPESVWFKNYLRLDWVIFTAPNVPFPISLISS